MVVAAEPECAEEHGYDGPFNQCCEGAVRDLTHTEMEPPPRQ